MNQWINGTPLSAIISQSINHFDTKGKDIQTGFKPTDKEVFDRSNKRQVNILISNLIEDIEYVL